MASPVELVLMWHMHQPEYRDYSTRDFRRPWVLLHAIKDYTDMAAHLEGSSAASGFVISVTGESIAETGI